MGRARRFGWWIAVLAFFALAFPLGRASAQEQRAEIAYLGRDDTQNLDRYQFTIRPGARLWDLAINHLPVIGFDESDQKAFELVEQAYKRRYPDRGAAGIRPGDSFILEVPIGTFVTDRIVRNPSGFEYISFTGDRLLYFPNDPAVVYRLVRQDQPSRAELLLTGAAGDPVSVARTIYGTDKPDFIQVRAVRAAVNDRTARVTVDLSRAHLDEFRNYRERASRVEDADTGLKAYSFPSDPEIPFVRVDDGIGDDTDPSRFPRLFRVMYYRDGTIKRYMITETGDTLASLGRPLSEEWSKLLPAFREWQPGQAEPLPPFSPAVNTAGQLLPGRILVLAHRPRAEQARPASPTRGLGQATDCFGIPLILLGAAGALARFTRGMV